MTRDERLKVLAELACHNGDEEVARDVEDTLRDIADARQDASANAHEAESLKASLQQAERERDEARERCGLGVEAYAELARVYEAERTAHVKAGQERDEARNAHGMACLAEAEQRGRAERAEADNAALLHALLSSLDAPITLELRKYVREKFEKESHPGAALLEYVRALEGVRRAADDALECMEEDWPTRPVTMSLRRACTTADALKVKP